jgi:hypothetical protein
MHLAMGHLDLCEMELERMKTHRSSDEARSFPFRGAAVMEVRLLIRKKDYGAAAVLAQEHIHDLQKLNDKSALVALVTLRALALGLSGDLVGCARELLDANDLGATSMKELQADYFHACGLILKQLDRQNAVTFESRSFRIWAAHRICAGRLRRLRRRDTPQTMMPLPRTWCRSTHRRRASLNLDPSSGRQRLSIIWRRHLMSRTNRN